MSFWIVTDSCSDLPDSYAAKQHMFTMVPLSYQVDGVTHLSSGDPNMIKTFYQGMREGKVSTTSQINEDTWRNALIPLLDEGHDVLCAVFSSGLSGTYNSSRLAVDSLKKEYPNRSLYAIDTLAASLGQGLMVDYIIKCRDNDGLSIHETAKWLEDNKLKFPHFFTVSDLKYLMRGGRVSAVSAYLGGMLNIKPVMHVDNNGKLIPVEKVQGRKRSLRNIITRVKETATNPKDQVVFIGHADCLEEAEWVAALLKEELHVKDVFISQIGPIIGSHAGPGTIAVFWFAKER